MMQNAGLEQYIHGLVIVYIQDGVCVSSSLLLIKPLVVLSNTLCASMQVKICEPFCLSMRSMQVQVALDTS